jgi:acyl-CoA thioester hydrolase
MEGRTRPERGKDVPAPVPEDRKAAPHGTALRVRYAETDAMGIAHHSVYYVWFEAARTEFCRDLGVPYSEWERKGIFLPVIETRCRHKAPLRYDEELIVQTRVADLDARSVTFGYRVLRASDGRLCAEGSTRHGFCGPDGRLLRGENEMGRWLAERASGGERGKEEGGSGCGGSC